MWCLVSTENTLQIKSKETKRAQNIPTEELSLFNATQEFYSTTEVL